MGLVSNILLFHTLSAFWFRDVFVALLTDTVNNCVFICKILLFAWFICMILGF